MRFKLVFLCVFVLVFSVLSPAFAQSKFFSTANRGGVEGAKQSAQLSVLQNEEGRMNACTAAGMIFAPTHASANPGGCVPNFTFSGGATVQNGLSVSGGLIVDGPSTLNSGLAIYGSIASFDKGVAIKDGLTVTTGNVSVVNRVTTGQLYVGSGNVGSIPTCTGDKKIQWSGTAWICVNDAFGATAATTEVDPQVGGLFNGRLCRSNGSQVICDAAVPAASAYSNPPACPNSQKLYWTGGVWSCIADQGLIAETDPKVGTLTGGKWCTSDGSKINCTSNDPSGGSVKGTAVRKCPTYFGNCSSNNSCLGQFTDQTMCSYPSGNSSNCYNVWVSCPIVGYLVP